MNDYWLALFILRIAGPAILLLNACLLLLVKAKAQAPSEITSVVVRVPTPRSRLIVTLLSLAAATYALDALFVIILAVVTRQWQGREPEWRGTEVGDFLGLVAFSTVAILGSLKEAQGKDAWLRKRVRVFAIFACLFEIAIVSLMVLSIDFRKEDKSPKIPENPTFYGLSLAKFTHLALAALRLLLSLPLLFALFFPRYSYIPTYVTPTPVRAVESTLLGHDNQSQYGTFNGTPAITNPPSPANAGQSVLPKKPDTKEDVSLDPTWYEMGLRISRLTPYLWPRKSKPLQILALLCIGLLLVGRLVNLALPLTFGALIGLFEKFGVSGEYQNPWPLLLLYTGLRFLQSSGGLPAIRDALWAPVMQYSDREMSQLTFNHLLNLSLAFHTRRKTGEILRILDRGSSINHILELILFSIFPTIIDIIVALAFFFIYFDWSLALVISIVMFAYVSASIALTTQRTKIRRKMNDQDVKTRGIHTDCLLNYETVKYFGGEDHEAQRYAKAIRKYQYFEYRVMLSLNLLNLIQGTIISLGMLAGSAIVADSIVRGKRRAPDFVVFITYLSQLYGPLNNLGYIYRSINQNLVDTERLINLLEEPTDVKDKVGASELVIKHGGGIEFDNVSFSYDGKTPALSRVSFKVPSGSKVALVGESGSGKSTILRLLYRFYDLQPGEGRILIDGNDIRDVTQSSLRKAIGVVPQDSVLFNTSVKHNIGYGKFDADEGEIESAAKLAQMHDRIMSFPEQYETKVGERGVRLSGGEKQRVAIARTLLKNPPILLLDEATSALDTSTERDIQKALQNLVKGRSSLSIAHRLSTIATADVILVLRNGQIVEQGSHKELLAENGIFAKMWADQISADKRAQSIGSPGKESVLGYMIDDVSLPLSADPMDLATADAGEFNPREQPIEQTEVIDSPSEDATKELHNIDQSQLETNMQDLAPNSPQEEPREAGTHNQQASYAQAAATAPTEDSAVVEPKKDISQAGTPSQAIAFPGKGDDTPSLHGSSVIPATSGNVTFSPGVDSPPSRPQTPEGDNKPKRKRISSQNFQRLARRISLGGRRADSSTSISSQPSEEASPSGSKDDGIGEDPAADKKGKRKKDKKAKKGTK